MARGVLVVTSAYIGSGLEANLRDGENCLIYPLGNAAAAVKCILESGNARIRNRLTRAATEFVGEKMTHERSIEYWSQSFIKINSQPIKPSIEDIRFEPAGRLDRLLGMRLGEMVRHVPHGRRIPEEAGEEWPHISVASQIPKDIFWDLARAADLADGGTLDAGNKMPSVPVCER